ncbi:solute carrier family 6 (neurotransmitter transporter), member 18, isoform CRA_d [Rattus norvegicus]|uniref:Transporter n=1 Tax=Rattus norvegicus TaxID=10116 RepID=A6JUX2_RAT|nr:sodium-dependent neutral amino acid transporter B(0)AT3 isoform X4 [Rattus norvegicus]EDL87659.1 solute carrier family 6 (neurotransmitter transporter), member 18, isoform CRA_d [Rattus norvegicus]|eukprot:XP_006227837.1 PREDICTED: sodium-dependent neutral amino acid transporter B(0)AT3 isoform X4 [Rattus norvegicus]
MAQASGMDPLVDIEDERPKWDNKLQYLLSCIGFAVGLGNIWRFPYLCHTHGGGAFLIPYFIALVFEGIPLFYIELAIGQRLRRGSIGVWKTISPYLGGVGLGCFSVSFLVSLYYNTILLWVLWFFLNSFQHPLPWSTCPLDLNRTGFVQECQSSGTVSYFWYRQTLNITSDISNTGTIQWKLFLCLVACWTTVYLCVIRGIESTGKVIYFTALFPYLVLTIFLIRGLTLPGATEGLTYLFTPNMKILQNPRVWLDAATQIFFSLSLAFGGHIAFASYNQPRNNCEKDAVTIALVNSMTSLYASITIFSIMGFKASNDYGRCLDRNILSLINEFDFPELSISRDEYPSVLMYLNATQPERVARLPLKTCHLEDFLDKSIWKQSSGAHVLGEDCAGLTSRVCKAPVPPRVVCFICFLSAICFTLQSGSYWLEIFDSFAASLNLIIFAFMEVVGVIHVYGIKRNIFPQERRSSIQAGYRLPVCSCPSCPHCGSLELLWLSYCSSTDRGGRTHIWKVL